MKKIIGILTATCLAAAFTPAAAQMSEAEIQQATDAMAAAGVPEEQIAQFRADIAAANARMEAFNAAPPAELPDLKSGDALLEEQRAEFEATYGDAPDAAVTFMDADHALKVTTCDAGEGWYVIEAKSPPGPGSAVFSAALNTNPDGSAYATLDFQTGDHRAGETLETHALVDGAYVFDGEVDISGPGGTTRGPLRVTLTCGQGVQK